jgi:hypothetical protein
MQDIFYDLHLTFIFVRPRMYVFDRLVGIGAAVAPATRGDIMAVAW